MFRNEEILDQSSESESEEGEDSVKGVKRKKVVDMESESEDEGVKREIVVNKEVTSRENGITPIPIKERPPTSSFSVTSRLPFPSRDSVISTQPHSCHASTFNVQRSMVGHLFVYMSCESCSASYSL